MKNLKLISILFFAISSSGYAQKNDTVVQTSDQKNNEIRYSREAKRKLVFGLKAGLNHSNVYDAQGQNFVANAKTGFAGGAFLAIPFGGFFGVQPEVLLSQKGFKSSGGTQNDNYTLERTSTYIDIPLQIQIKPFRFISLLGGIQYSYLLNQTDKLDFGPNSIERSSDFKNDNVRKNILGAVGGADINIRHVVLSGRVGWDLIANRGNGSSYTPRYKNLWTQVTIGYRFY